MSIEALRNEVSSLPADERRKLMAFMVVLEDEDRTGYAEKLAQQIGDKSPNRWLTAEQCEQKLGLAGDAK
jgi:hypothetical protein